MDRHDIPRFLPENYRFAAAREDGAMAGLLAAMEGLHAPDEHIIANLDRYVSPVRAPDPFVLLQASWLGLDRYFDWSGGRPGAGRPVYRAGIDQLRLLVAETAELTRRRGRTDTLIRFLELATGVHGFAVSEGDPDGKAHAFHITVRAPAAARPLARLISRVVEGERPAHATYDIVYPDPDHTETPAP